ncbi:peptidoglycan-binding protein [Demequina sp. SO4-18]|uniref:peptidoglycan-binding protein n=1 Tax=Demequina sp. SO4-18 TaxID=3401026 RepID=UPI003B5A56D2
MTAIEPRPSPQASQPTLEEVSELVGQQKGRVRRIGLGAAAAGVTFGVGVTALVGAATAPAEAEEAAVALDLTTVAVESRDLETYTEYAGTLGYGDAVTALASDSGIVTAVADPSDALVRGDVAFSVDDEPVALLYGELPMWRDLDTDSEDGADILQLETNLAALGFTDNGDMSVDETFTTATANALEAWEQALGREEPDGVLTQGEVTYAMGELRVDSGLERGESVEAGTEVLKAALTSEVVDAVSDDGEVTSAATASEVVSLSISTNDQDQFEEGASVEVELADETVVPGTIQEVAETPERVDEGPDAELALAVTVVVDSGEGEIVEGPANVRVADAVRESVTMVPVRALVALLEGGYAVEVAGDDGSLAPVAVEIGSFEDGWVEITGDVRPGENVVVPS